MEAKAASVCGVVCGGRKKENWGERGGLNRLWEDGGDPAGKDARDLSL